MKRCLLRCGPRIIRTRLVRVDRLGGFFTSTTVYLYLYFAPQHSFPQRRVFMFSNWLCMAPLKVPSLCMWATMFLLGPTSVPAAAWQYEGASLLALNEMQSPLSDSRSNYDHSHHGFNRW